MTTSEFLKEKLFNTALQFPNGKFSYEYDKYSDMHIIQVFPVELYEEDKSYQLHESHFTNEFDKMFFPESVLFVSDNSLTKVLNPEFEVTGLFYGLEPVISSVKYSCFDFLNEEVFNTGDNNYALAA